MDKEFPPFVLPLRLWAWMARLDLPARLAVCGGVAFFVLVGIGGAAYAAQSKTIVRGVTIAGQDVGDLDALTALHRVQKQWNTFTTKGFTFTGGGQTFTVPTVTTSTDNEIVVDLVDLDITKAVNRAYDFGHRGPWWKKASQRLSGWLGREHRFGTLILDRQSLADALQKNLVTKEKPAVSAGLTMTDTITITVTPSAPGQTFDYPAAVHRAHRQLTRLQTTPIAIKTIVVQPGVVDDPGLQALAASDAPSALNLAPLTVTSGEKKWTIDRTQLSKLLGFRRDGKRIVVSFDEGKTTVWLTTIKSQVETQPQNAKFAIIDSKVKEFQASAIGRMIDIPATIKAMAQMLAEKKNAAALVIIESKPITDTTSTNNLGVTELIAEGTTNFRGSPTNRRFNLTYGTQKLNGLLIAPGETFSLVTALGKIDKAHGWKSELVIKGTDITPEYGGGLCQVATTLFRTILNAGLPVVERHNHSLRIRYYEPPIGLDATIYEPKPDLRFTNDYGGYLLLQTKVDGDNLTYSFYGTKDGRKVDLPEPRVYNRTGIPATKNIEVDDLKPGEKVCQAPGHPGADATATYTVTKIDGTAVTQTFQSHYRALPIICRVGKAKTSTTSKKPAVNTNTTASPQ